MTNSVHSENYCFRTIKLTLSRITLKEEFIEDGNNLSQTFTLNYVTTECY